jgi:putative nucleotidyltransferase with HDIG domain
MNRELENAINTAKDLPTIPTVATRVMQLVESETATAEELAKVVAADPSVAARVLKISNSAFYGCQRKVQTLSSAIVILGLRTLRSIVVTASVKQVYKPFGLTEQLLWEHSFGAALAARIIASNTRLANEEEAFLGGLFHDIGKIVMNTLDKEKFQTVMQLCYNGNSTFAEAEKNVFPFCHDEVGAFVIKKWNFPETLTDAVMQHHRLEFKEADDCYLIQLTSVLTLADLFCHKLGIGEREPDEELDISHSKAARLCNLDDNRIGFMLATFQESFKNNRGAFMM